ncbi:LysR family transcriptional regulator [Winslowiella iniecta]|uniref:LysR family transcriptional regulator n=1 Tax=Winslowiella iniecta TaxID=1560201 RepID=UPI00069FCB87|nr:LysR family transcriptional regulator [Winslowiella iniecta]
MTTFRELEAFVAVVDMGSFKGAARALNTSQSAISRLIRELEAGFDLPLFDREKRSSQITMTGVEVLHIAREILRERNRLAERFVDKSLVAPLLRLGVNQLASLSWLPHCVRQLKKKYPDMQLEIESGTSAELYSQIRSGKLDIVVVNEAIRSQDMVRIPAGEVEIGWYCKPERALAESTSLRNLEQNTLLLQPLAGCAGSVIGAWLSARSIKIRDAIQCNSWSSLITMANQGTGVASVPTVLAQASLRRGELKPCYIDSAPVKLNYVVLVKIDEISPFHRAVIATIKKSHSDYFCAATHQHTLTD